MSNTTLPNPFTPMAFLPPDIASQVEVERYVCAGALGAALWDILTNLGNDYRLLTEFPIRIPTVVYFLSRLSMLIFLLLTVILTTAIISNCAGLLLALCIVFAVAHLSTALLFWLRVDAIWCRRKTIRVVFSLLWLIYLGALLTGPIGLRASHIGPTEACITNTVPSFTQAIFAAALVYDTAIFIATTYGILSMTVTENQLEAFWTGRSMSRLARALVQSGQSYYLAALSCNVMSFILIMIPTIPIIYHNFLNMPAIFIINSMACIVFRKIKFGVFTSNGTSILTGGILGTLPLHHTGRNAIAFHTSEIVEARETRTGKAGVSLSKLQTEAEEEKASVSVLLSPAKS